MSTDDLLELIEQRLVSLCHAVNEVDDKLGQRSDHDGPPEGPSYRLFREYPGIRKYLHICDMQIKNHQEAASLWAELRALKQLDHRLRKPPRQPAPNL